MLGLKAEGPGFGPWAEGLGLRLRLLEFIVRGLGFRVSALRSTGSRPLG